jgi:hypothetical protein
MAAAVRVERAEQPVPGDDLPDALETRLGAFFVHQKPDTSRVTDMVTRTALTPGNLQHIMFY